ncbi:uncharacterized protein EURHEDRAFT_184099 [Aspergillus ruber CBS 135680]|uniref:Uncharacterized protein n=1 Tax=Aspergillus ruber (strain CBS 135680) TaxID=1388766 RepID=A0A017S8P7_ASPRC|nr:uncharacterized protein EURHEDRAFT_184099 [Aspergillus ruber CBS 135680]EYE92530.1 hypothetical protein EURHEDRAFT_184099 [Aspergillus ruber CBS 135680]
MFKLSVYTQLLVVLLCILALGLCFYIRSRLLCFQYIFIFVLFRKIVYKWCGVVQHRDI